MKKYTVFMITMVIAILLFGTICFNVLPRETKAYDKEYSELNDGWYVVENDGTKTPITIPCEIDVPKGEWCTYEGVLPEITDGRHVIMLRSSQQDLEVYIDGVLRERYSTEGKRIWGKSSMSSNVFVDLDKEDSGKPISIRLKSVTSYSGTINTVMFGSLTGIEDYIFKKNGPGLLVALFLCFAGVVVLIVCIVLQVRYKKVFPMVYAAWNAIVVSLMAIFESRLRQFYFPNITISGAVSYMLIGMMPVSMLLYIDAVQKERYKKIYNISLGVCSINILVNIILQVAGVQDLLVSNTRSYILFVISFFVILFTLVMDYKKGFIKDIRFPVIGVLLAYVMGFAEIITTLLHIITVVGLFLTIGMGFLLSAAVVESIDQIEKINEEHQQAILANVAKSEFLANMSHEIRTPINAIMGMNEMVLREAKDEEIKKYAVDIDKASNNLLDIVNDILDFSKIEAGKMEVVTEVFDAEDIIRDVYNIVSIRARNKNLQLNINADPNFPKKIYGDAIRVRQILLNLINNAIKYTSEGSVTWGVSFKKNEDPQIDADVFIITSIKDTGIGIKEEDKDKLFKNFQRLDIEKNRSIEGTGLGLAITYRLMKLMGGDIEVKSEYGKGSEFIATIPRKIEGTESIGDIVKKLSERKVETTEYHEKFKAPDAKILVVDDVKMNVNVITGLLKKTEVQVVPAYSGKECIEKCEQEKFDIILMDHMMPEMDGIETLEKLKESGLANMPIIVLTANAIEGMREMYLGKGFTDYLSKPIKADALEETLKRYLGK